MLPQNTADFLRDLASPDAAVRQAAAASARTQGAGAIAGLGDLASGPDKAVAKAARKALEDIAHHAARPGAKGKETQAVADQMALLTDAKRPRALRAHALHLLGFVGRDKNVAGIARLLSDPQVGDDARMALERINTGAARKALKR